MVLCWPIKQNIKKIHIKELKEQTEQSERTDGMTHRNEKENVSRYWNTAIVIKTESLAFDGDCHACFPPPKKNAVLSAFRFMAHNCNFGVV